MQWNPVYTQGVGRPQFDWLPLRRFVVQDTSMRPALEPRDRVLVIRGRRYRPGDLVVFREPDRHLTFAIKRVAEIRSGGSLFVLGDNPNVSRDSRDFGPLSPDLVVGKVVYRYLPGERRGQPR